MHEFLFFFFLKKRFLLCSICPETDRNDPQITRLNLALQESENYNQVWVSFGIDRLREPLVKFNELSYKITQNKAFRVLAENKFIMSISLYHVNENA